MKNKFEMREFLKKNTHTQQTHKSRRFMQCFGLEYRTSPETMVYCLFVRYTIDSYSTKNIVYSTRVVKKWNILGIQTHLSINSIAVWHEV